MNDVVANQWNGDLVKAVCNTEDAEGTEKRVEA